MKIKACTIITSKNIDMNCINQSFNHYRISFEKKNVSLYIKKIKQFVQNQIETRMCPMYTVPHPHYHFLCSVYRENGVKSLIWH